MKKTTRRFLMITMPATFILLGTYLVFIQGWKQFEVEINTIERSNHVEFSRKKDSIGNLISLLGPEYKVEFDKVVSSIDFRDEKDSSYSLLFFSKEKEWVELNSQKLECLPEICKKKIEDKIALVLIGDQKYALNQKYLGLFSFWYDRLEAIATEESVYSDPCNLVPSFKVHRFNPSAWLELDRIISEYRNEQERIKGLNKQGESEVRQLANGYLNRFISSKAKQDFLSEANMFYNEYLDESEYQGTINSYVFGVQHYTLKQEAKLNTDRFKRFAERKIEDQWRHYSLPTGAMPYKNCYGSKNSCGGYNCSEVLVKNYGSDVVVTIKNSHGKVIRHGYIRDGAQFKFNIPDGAYQVFFYAGKGWNPEKSMAGSCSTMKGGFVDSENVTKDDRLTLYGQIITYELRLQENGNFNPKQSSQWEAF